MKFTDYSCLQLRKTGVRSDRSILCTRLEVARALTRELFRTCGETGASAQGDPDHRGPERIRGDAGDENSDTTHDDRVDDCWYSSTEAGIPQCSTAYRNHECRPDRHPA